MTYADKIKKLREVMLVSQSELAEILGVSFVTVNRWENGKYEPTIKIKRKLSELFNQYEIDKYNRYILIDKNDRE
jgi:DNA-binding XRE family transcriptional regulator